MPQRLTLTFPGNGGKDIEFTCTSGDFDPGPELDAAVAQIESKLDKRPWAPRLTLEDV